MASTEGIHYFPIENFQFQNGTTLPKIKVAYRIFNPTATKTVLIPTCFRGRINGTLNFVDGVFRDHRVIVVALLGNGESSSPSNEPSFPNSLDYRDCVRAQHQLVTQHLGLSNLDVVAGFSMGGQCTYHWIAMYPDMVEHAVIICSSARTSLHNYQFLEGPRAALENSIDYVDGAFRSDSNRLPLRGLHAFGLAYSAWLTSAPWFEQRCFEKMGHKSLTAWSEAGMQGYNDWHPENLLVMLRMWQNSDLGVHCASGSVEETLAQIKVPVLLMPCQTDQYFTWQASEKEAQLLKHAEFEAIPSIWGHIGGGGANPEDSKWMGKRIAKFLGMEG